MIVALLILVVAAGCSKPPDMRDQRLAEFAREAMTEQRKQNDRIADQSEAVVQESRQLAEGAKEMVERDAEARRELVSAQRELNSQLNEQRSAVDAGRDDLEQERRQIAKQRNRAPLVAAAIQNAGLIIACLLPLIVCVVVIRQMRSEEPDDAAVAQLLIQELTSDDPRLLPEPALRPALTHQSVEESPAAHDGADS
jgi:hypothetical protein